MGKNSSESILVIAMFGIISELLDPTADEILLSFMLLYTVLNLSNLVYSTAFHIC